MGFNSGPPPARLRSPLASLEAGAVQQHVYIELSSGQLVKALIMNLELSYDQGRLGYFGNDIRAGEQRVSGQPMRIKLEAIVIEDNVSLPVDDKLRQVMASDAREQRSKRSGALPPKPPKPAPKSATVRRFEDLEPVEPEKK